jgi:hypothetical protein
MNYRELPEISEKQIEIVELVFKFRFINRHQLQKLFKHKDPSRLNKWLKELVEKKYLGRIYSNKLLENTKPSIYYLGNNGIVWAKWHGLENHSYEDGINTKYVKKFYQDKEASQSFIDHSINMFDIYIQFKQAEKKNLEFGFETKTEMWISEKLQYQDEDFDDIKDMIPDASVEKMVEKKDSMETQLYFIILFDPHVPRFAIRYKINKYIEAFDETDGKRIKHLTSEFPTFLFIFPTQQKASQMGKYIKKQLDSSYITGMKILVSTLDKVKSEGIFGELKTWTVITDD